MDSVKKLTKDNINSAYFDGMGKTMGYRTRERINSLVELVEGERVLDVGCSGGIMDILLARTGKTVLGLDFMQDSIDEADALKNAEDEGTRSRLTFKCADFLSFYMPGEKFDTVVMSEVLEHINNPEEFVIHAQEFLKDGGQFIVSVPFGMNPAVDHKRTYYLSSILETLSPYFEIEHYSIIKGTHSYIIIDARNTGCETELDYQAINRESEEAYYQKEKELYNKSWFAHGVVQTGLEKNGKELMEKVDYVYGKLYRKLEGMAESNASAIVKAETKVQKAESKLIEAQARERELKLELKRADERLEAAAREYEEKLAAIKKKLENETAHTVSLRSDVQRERNNYEKLKNSGRYRIGTKIAGCRSNPFKLFAVPFWAAKEFKNAKKGASEQPAAKPAATASAKNAKPKYVAYENIPVRNPDITIAAIMDEFTYSCYKHECHIIRVSKENYRKEVEGKKIDFLFVESAWRGNCENWRYLVHNQHGVRDELKNLVEYFRAQGVTTVFWNKEDPVHYDDFNLTAGLFDHVFTTDENCIPKYKADLGHDRVYLLMFAAQFKVHNPFMPPEWKHKELLNNVCFAGTYYNLKYADRNAYINAFCDAAMKYGLDIYNRMSAHPKADEQFKFPERYASALHPAVEYEKLLLLHNRYRVFININSITNSPTMFARRVFELLACGRLVLSSPSVGVEKLFGDVVCIAENEQQADAFLDKAVHDDEFFDRRRLRGIRAVHAGHSYADRFNELLTRIGMEPNAYRESGCTVVVATNRQHYIDRVFRNYTRQTYEPKQLVVVLNSNDMDIDVWRAKAAEYPQEDITILQKDESESLGACLNAGFELAKYPFFTKMDDDDFYAPMYLSDMIMYFDFCDADIIGKTAYTIYFEGMQKTAQKFPGFEYTHNNVISGATMVFRRKVWEAVPFIDRPRGTDTAFLSAAKEAGFDSFAADRFNFTLIRRADPTTHTWTISDEEHIKRCTILDGVTDYEEYVTVD